MFVRLIVIKLVQSLAELETTLGLDNLIIKITLDLVMVVLAISYILWSIKIEA